MITLFVYDGATGRFLHQDVGSINSIMLDLILRKYSRKYRKYLKLKKKNK